MTAPYTPSEDEMRVIVWLMRKSQRYHEYAVRYADEGEDAIAAAYIQGSATLASAASDIRGALHHDMTRAAAMQTLLDIDGELYDAKGETE